MKKCELQKISAWMRVKTVSPVGYTKEKDDALLAKALRPGLKDHSTSIPDNQPSLSDCRPKKTLYICWFMSCGCVWVCFGIIFLSNCLIASVLVSNGLHRWVCIWWMFVWQFVFGLLTLSTCHRFCQLIRLHMLSCISSKDLHFIRIKFYPHEWKVFRPFRIFIRTFNLLT